MGINAVLFKKEAQHHRLFFFLLLSTACVAAIWLLRNYLSLIFVSLVYSVLIRPLYRVFNTHFAWPKNISSAITVFITFITIVLPVILIGAVVVQEALNFRQTVLSSVTSPDVTIEGSVEMVNAFLMTVPGVSYEVSEAEVVDFFKTTARPAAAYLANWLIGVGASSAVLIANLFIFLILVFFILPSLTPLKKYLLRLSPMPDKIDQLYVARIISMTRAMIRGTFLVAVIQGVLGGLLLAIMGIPYILILTLIMILCAIIPVLSTMAVTYPIAIYFIVTGDVVKGIIIILVQTLVISTIDNILRPVLASGEGDLHPGILLIAILGGLQVFGFLGIIYGPIILIFLTTSLEIYQKYYR